jgi:hypothetical protein
MVTIEGITGAANYFCGSYLPSSFTDYSFIRQFVISSYYVQLIKIIMSDEYITPDRKHSALLIIDVQRDFTLKGAAAEIPGTLTSVQYIKSLNVS